MLNANDVNISTKKIPQKKFAKSVQVYTTS